MKLADYIFYKEQYCGTALDEGEFSHYINKASKHLLRYVGELSETERSDEVRFCVCELCDILCEADTHSGIDYERNDGYWVSYDGTMSLCDKIKDCVFTWLSGSGLLYRGCIS